MLQPGASTSSRARPRPPTAWSLSIAASLRRGSSSGTGSCTLTVTPAVVVNTSITSGTWCSPQARIELPTSSESTSCALSAWSVVVP